MEEEIAAALGRTKSAGSAENVQVLVRIRPLIGREAAFSIQEQAIYADDKTVHVKTADHNIRCEYDCVMDPTTTQAMVYENVAECTDSVCEGFNATLFAYGQTGSGKSHTMFGMEGDMEIFSREGSDHAGVIPRAIRAIFTKAQASDQVQELTVFCSFCQIYNEHLFDLLRDPEMSNPLVIHEDRKHGIYVEGLSEYQVRSTKETLSVLRQGEENRAIRSTHMNQVSSRSHSLFQLQLEQRRGTADGAGPDDAMLRSKYNLVDLAGSEKWNKDSEMIRAHVSEMTNINLSLHNLGRCIAALATASKQKRGRMGRNNDFIPYRDSKLTRLLQVQYYTHHTLYYTDEATAGLARRQHEDAADSNTLTLT
jgi:kinesin family protein 3/17